MNLKRPFRIGAGGMKAKEGRKESKRVSTAATFDDRLWIAEARDRGLLTDMS